ncbi:MAG TPA: tetratricopeptide repeat protein [Acidobacteriota bacterium]|nr:tetratricopeptide repeat protein [Acidobacteriota bacterium]
MRKITIGLALLVMAFSFLHAAALNAAQSDEELFQEAKILIFDKKWEQAREKLDDLLVRYPQSPLYSQALFYLGKCLSEQEGEEREAIEVYKRYQSRRDADKNLIQESEIEIIDLSYKLYDQGKKSYLKEIEKALESRDRAVKYYAAFKLSYLSDERTARKGFPVLEEILDQERDPELRERAKLAVLRINPELLKNIEDEEYDSKPKLFCLRVYKRGEKEASFSLNIPWALADLALNSIPEEDKESLRKEGYDLDGILKKLTKVKGNIIEIKDEESIIKIWIE